MATITFSVTSEAYGSASVTVPAYQTASFVATQLCSALGFPCSHTCVRLTKQDGDEEVHFTVMRKAAVLAEEDGVEFNAALKQLDIIHVQQGWSRRLPTAVGLFHRQNQAVGLTL